MIKKLFKFSDAPSSQAPDSVWALLTFLFAYIAASVFYAVLILQTGAWQLKVVLVVTLLLAVVTLIA